MSCYAPWTPAEPNETTHIVIPVYCHSRESGTKARSALNAQRAARRVSAANHPVTLKYNPWIPGLRYAPPGMTMFL